MREKERKNNYLDPRILLDYFDDLKDTASCA